MILPGGLQYDGMHTFAGNVKTVMFGVLGLKPAPDAPVAQYDRAVNRRRNAPWVASESRWVVAFVVSVFGG